MQLETKTLRTDRKVSLLARGSPRAAVCHRAGPKGVMVTPV